MVASFFRTKSLVWQLLLVVSLSLVTAIALFATYDILKAQDAAYRVKLHEAEGLSSHLASQIILKIHQRDLSGIEYFLKESSSFKDINAIRVIDAQANLLSEVEQDSTGQLIPTYETGLMSTPEDKVFQVEDIDGAMDMWVPMFSAGTFSGWLNLIVSTHYVDVARNESMAEFAFLSFMLILFVMISVYFIMRGRLSELDRAVEFARHLPENAGKLLGVEMHSSELVALEQALNGASQTLNDKEKRLERSREQLQGRLKQLNCIYVTTKILSDPLLSIDKKMSAIVSLLPSAMRSPQNAHAKIVYFGKEYLTEAHKDCLYSIFEALKVGRQYVGMIEVGLQAKQNKLVGDSAFLKDEVSLLQEVAARINNYLRQNEIQTSLETMNEELDRRVVERTYELEKARDLALKASEVKSDFLSSISHEFRTPMNAIIGFAHLMMQENASLNDGQKEALQYISDAGAHMMSLVDNVLDLAQLESGVITLKYEMVNVRDVLDKVGSMLESVRLARDIELHFDIDLPGREYPLDKLRFSQILLNLVNNAIKYNKARGKVFVRLSLEDKNLKIVVEDNGRGVSEENLEKLFDAFYRVQDGNMEDGVGVGLSVVKQLVDLMRGSIHVESEAGLGSCFTVIIPVGE